jgi:hypothetical protein
MIKYYMLKAIEENRKGLAKYEYDTGNQNETEAKAEA